MHHKLAPNPAHGPAKVVTAHGRFFAPSDGVLDMHDTDLAIEILGGAGWTRLPPHGPTSERPKNGAPGGAYIDDDLGEVVFAQVYPTGSGIIVGWCDFRGDAA